VTPCAEAFHDAAYEGDALLSAVVSSNTCISRQQLLKKNVCAHHCWRCASAYFSCCNPTQEDSDTLNKVQERFDVDIKPLPASIDTATYMNQS
jgi:hypothetical protein